MRAVSIPRLMTGWTSGPPAEERKAQAMKHVPGTALRVAVCLVLLGVGVALYAGKDDIRKFLRMRSM